MDQSITMPTGTQDTDRQRLITLIKERSFQSGDTIKLASGRSSNFYFNMKPTMLHAEGAYLIGKLIIDELAGRNVDFAGGLEMGAVPIAASVAAVSHAQGTPIQAFFVRKQAKEHGTQSLVEGLSKDETMADKNVVVLEDVTTTGGSALKAADNLKREGANIVCVITIVDRQEGAGEAFKNAGYDFRPLLTIEDFKD